MAVSKVVSIEISDLVTRVCEVAYNKKNPTVYKSFIFDNPEYSVDDGFITNRSAFVSELKAKLKEAGIKCKDVVFVLSSNKVMSREVTVPEMKEDFLDDLIENERGNYFPMDTSDHIFTYHLIETLKEEKQQRIMVFAAPEILIKNYQALAAEMDMKIIAIDYFGNTMYQWLKNSGSEMSMYIQINEKSSVFNILENNLLELQRNMNFGATTLTNALQYNGYYGRDISNTDAYLKIRDNDMLYHSFVAMEDADPEDSEQERMHQAKSDLTEAVRPFISNIQRVLEYYSAKNREAKVTTIYMGGVGAYIKGLKELIESEFNGIEIVAIEGLPNVNFAKKNMVGIERSTEFIACIGAAYRTINFYKVSEQVKLEKTLIFCIVALVLVIAASIFIILNGKFEYDDAVDRQNELKSKITELEATGIELTEQEYYIAREKAQAVLGADADTFTHNENWNDILDYLESESVSGIVVSSIASTESSLSMNIIVPSKEDVAKLLLQYQKIPYFSSVSISSITENVEPDTGFKSVSFALLCTYKKPEAVTEQTEGTEEVAE